MRLIGLAGTCSPHHSSGSGAGQFVSRSMNELDSICLTNTEARGGHRWQRAPL